jgi:signal transduction histidine kinase
MAPGVAIGGWVAAMIAAVTAMVAWRALASRMHSVSRACHELRGPLTAARLGLELVARPGALSPARIRALDLELGRAALAVDDLAEIRAGRRPPGAWDEVDLRTLVADSVEAWCPAAEWRGAGVELIGGEGCAAAIVRGDRLRLAQAVGNLLSNAIEHGGGRIEVRVVGRRGGGSAVSTVRIEFADEGPGLPAPVGELVRQGRRSRGSHGHGLVVAASVAAVHGGRLGSAPSERGARLVLELPAAVAGGAGGAGGA